MQAVAGDQGSELVEFAFASIIILGCLFTILYGSVALYADHYVAGAAREGARYAMVRGSSWGGLPCATISSFSCTATDANVASFVKSTLAPGLSPNDLTVTTNWPGTTPAGAPCDTTNGTNSPYCSVNIKVSYSLKSFLPFLPRRALLFSSSSTASIMD